MAASEGRNVMPALIEAARADVTEGEMVQALQAVFGRHKQLMVF
jgi:methylmalonyl-CoA mutase N-terminal domain/subunit